MRVRMPIALAVLFGTSCPPVYWAFASGADERQAKDTIAEVEVGLAQARCELARQNLEGARAQKLSPRLVLVHELALNCFEQELVDLKSGETPDSFERQLAEMKHLVRFAEGRLQQAQDTNAASPGAIANWELAQLRAKCDILRFGVAHGELLRTADRQAKIDWQLEQLRSLQLLLADWLFAQGM